MRLKKIQPSIRFDGGKRIPGMKAWRLGLIMVIVGLVAFLASAEKPWDKDLLESIGRREAEGKTWKIEHYAAVYLWWAALVNLALTAGLLLSTGWWARPLAGVPEAEQAQGLPRWFWLGVALVVALGAWERVPRLQHSFWNDEEYGFRTYVWGVAEVNESDALMFNAVSWQESFFRNKANNHIFYTVLARISHEVWELVSPEEGAPFNEAVIRFVPFLAGLGSLVAVAWLLASCGNPGAGITAGLFLALNPWHLRYSVEARGYAYVLLLVILLLICLRRSLRTGEWKEWLAYGACQAALLLSFPAELYLLAVLNALVVLHLCIRTTEENRARRQQAGRLVVANILGAMVFLQIMAPSIPQMRAYLNSDTYPGVMGWGWLKELWAHLCIGIPWSTADTSLHLGTSVFDQADNNPLLQPLIFFVIPLLALAGLIYLFLKVRGIFALGIVALLGSGFLEFFHNFIEGRFVHVWYEIVLVMALAVLVALGAQALSSIARTKRHAGAGKIAGTVISVIFLIVYAAATADARARIRNHDRQPLRAVVREVRGESPAFSARGAGILTGSFGTSKGMIKSYDPWDRVLKSADDLEALIAEADATGKPMFVYLCGRIQAQRDDPEMLAIVEEKSRFEKLPEREAFKGLEELFSYHVYRYRGKE